jgi:hypothetical protein
MIMMFLAVPPPGHPDVTDKSSRPETVMKKGFIKESKDGPGTLLPSSESMQRMHASPRPL